MNVNLVVVWFHNYMYKRGPGLQNPLASLSLNTDSGFGSGECTPHVHGVGRESGPREAGYDVNVCP